MTTAATSTLAQGLRERSESFLRQIGPAIDMLIKIASQYERPDDPKSRTARLKEIRQSVETDTFRVIVLGRFKNGKSTFLNALLGRVTHPIPELPLGGAPLPTSDLPCTPTLTSIYYQDKPSIRMLKKNSNTWQDVSLKWYLNEARVRSDSEENNKFFEDIRQFELGFPVELCKAGVTLLDSPGTDDDLGRDAITDEALVGCDAAIVLYRSDPFAGKTELQYVQDMIESGLTSYFSVVNLWNGRPVDDQFKGFTWDRLVTTLKKGPRYQNQDFEAENIYFVDAKAALEGKLSGNTARIQMSGLTQFEERLHTFLEKERRAIHVQRFVQGADSHAQALSEIISKRIPMIQMEQASFQAKYAAIQPELQRIRARRDNLTRIFERNRKDCQQNLQDGFVQLFDDIRRDLPAELMQRKIPSLHTSSIIERVKNKALAQIQKKKLANEAATIGVEIVKQKVEAWQRAVPPAPGAQQIITESVAKLVEEVTAEVVDIERQYEQVHYQLTGWIPDQAQLNMRGPGGLERAAAIGVGLFLGQPDYIVTGGVAGFKGMGRDLAGRLAIGVPLLLLHVSLPVVAVATIATGLLTSLFWGANSLEKEIKQKLVHHLIVGDPITGEGGLRDEPERAKPHLEALVENVFGKIEDEVSQKVDLRINEEEQAIQASLKDSARGSEEKRLLIELMKKNLQAIAASHQTLNEALNAAKQI